jgi:nanoRNase/pAp phosphatase (c-di-AMP/oligoRNAs hydrolase)
MESKVRNIRYKASDIQHPQVTNKPRLISPYNPEEMVIDHHPTTKIINPLVSSNINNNINSTNSNTNTITKLKRLFGL